ncbi:MAG: insulinase family protein, partial [Alphaproteobacteria bacterium]|nr:insulinase family protein [Alphaproteobacteria bacterium]
MRNNSLLALLATVATFAAVLAPARAAVFNPESFTLDNGLQVVVIPNHRAPVVTHMVYYKVGAMDEPVGKSGIAHFLEHLMFKGTKTLKPGEFSTIVARNGGKENAFTSQDYTGYYQSVAADRLEEMMRIEADRMANLVL